MMEVLFALALGALAVWIIGIKIFTFRQRWEVEKAFWESKIRLWRMSGDYRWLER